MKQNLFFFLAVLLSLSGSDSRAQQIDPYARVLDPLGIADLGGADSFQVQHKYLVGGGTIVDPDNYKVLFDVLGPGIVSHIWVTHPSAAFDTVALIKVYLDDTVIYAGNIAKFFTERHGRLRPPLNGVQSGGLVCDVQMPFKKNFRLTFFGKSTLAAFSWRAVADPSQIYSFRPDDTTGIASQFGAEQVIRRSLIADLPSDNIKLDRSFVIPPGEKAVLLEVADSGIIQKLQFNLSDYDPQEYRDLWLRCYWDGSPYASIDAPVADLFGAAYGITELDALQLKSRPSEGLTCLLPMPFRHGARVELHNRSSEEISLVASMSIAPGLEIRPSLGRLHVQFNEVRAPRFKHLLPILHVKGRGRAVGVMLNMPPDVAPSFLEGDPFITADSTLKHFVRYPGTEDYFNGGWYFRDGPFSLPFAGCPVLWTTIYRFHYLDAMNFTRSFDWEWQHGMNNDYAEHYRTVAYFYLEPTYFWAERDSVALGEQIEISGHTSRPSTPVRLIIGEIADSTISNVRGEYRFTLNSSQLGIGHHTYSINDVGALKHLSVIPQPTIEYVIDSQYKALSILDSIHVTMRGFQPNTNVDVSLDDHVIAQGVLTDQRGVAVIHCMIGRLDSGSYQLRARSGDIAIVASVPVRITRTLRYEVEDMLPAVASDCRHASEYMGWWNFEFWSNSRMLFIYPEDAGQGITLRFDVPLTDNYSVALAATKGSRYSNMRVAIDDRDIGEVKGYFNDDFNTPHKLGPVALSPIVLSKGTHTLKFTAESRDPAAFEWVMGPDALFLTPLGDGNAVEISSGSEIELSIFYNEDGVHYRVRSADGSRVDGELALLDNLGREVLSLFRGKVSGISGSFSMGHLPSGTYFLRLRAQKGISIVKPVALIH